MYKKIVTVEEHGNDVNLFILLIYKNIVSKKKLSSSQKTERKDKEAGTRQLIIFIDIPAESATRQIRPRNCSSFSRTVSSTLIFLEKLATETKTFEACR